MSKSVNKVILVGNVGKDPDIKYTPSGVPLAKLSLATNEKYKDKSGEWQERTEWHNLVLWQRLAEIVGDYVKKGSKVYVEGRLQTSNWEDKQSGEKKYRTEIVVGELVLLGTNGNGNGEHSRPAGYAGPRQKAANARQELRHEPVEEETGITDEDIPF